MAGMNKALKSALGLLVAAVLLFVISGIDGIELVGKYEINDPDEMGVPEDFGKIYMTLGITGKMSVDMKFSGDMKKELKEELGDDYKEFMNEMEKGIEEGNKDMKWSLEDGRIVNSNGDSEETVFYSLKGSTLKFYENKDAKDDGEDYIKLKKTFFSSLTCPSGLLRIVAVILILAAALMFLGGKGSEGADWKLPASFSGGSATSTRCDSCGGIIPPGGKFCETCGKPVGAAPASTPMTARCEVCGSPVNPGAKFCEGCGSPIGGGIAPAPTYAEPAPTYAEPAPTYAEPAPTYAEPAPTYAEPAPTPAPMPNPMPTPAPASAQGTKPASDHSRFSAAGDL